MTIEEAINIIETSTYLWLRTTDLERTALSMALEALADRKTEQQTGNGIGCSRCEGRIDCYDRDMPHAVQCNNYGKITDEPPKRPCDSCQEWDCYGCDYKQTERENNEID